MIKRLIATLLLLALLFGGVFGWKYYQGLQQQAGQGMAPPVVSTETARRDNWQPSLPAVGTVVPTRGVIVAAEVPGIVREIHFNSGESVQAGDPLVDLDADVDVAEVAALEADRRLAEITRDRLKRIVNDNLGSRSDLDEAEAALDSTTARVAAKRATIRKKSIRAPFAGELGIRRVNPGQYLAPGDRIVELVALDPIFVEYALPERYLGDLEVGQAVNVSVRSSPDLVLNGRVDAISPSIEQATRSVTVRALFENPDRLLRPGMFAEVQTMLPREDAVMTLPERAVTYNPYGDSVFVVNRDSGSPVVSRVQVETGRVHDDRIEVLAGLPAGAEVVTDGHNKLRNDQQVAVDNSRSPDATDAPQ